MIIASLPLCLCHAHQPALVACFLGGESDRERKVIASVKCGRAHCCFRWYRLGGFDTGAPVLDTYQIDKEEG